MSFKYISKNSGQKTGVTIPIEAWDLIISKHSNVGILETGITQLHMEEIKRRVEYYDNNPDKLVSWGVVRQQLKLG